MTSKMDQYLNKVYQGENKSTLSQQPYVKQETSQTNYIEYPKNGEPYIVPGGIGIKNYVEVVENTEPYCYSY